MVKRVFGTFLIVIALFMTVGFLKAKPDVGTVALAVTFFIAVVVPGAAGGYLWWTTFAEREALARRREDLRRQTLEAELLRLAERRGGKLMVVEAAGELAFGAAVIEETLNAMADRGLAEVEISESGVLVYAFYDVRHLGEKEGARGVLDA